MVAFLDRDERHHAWTVAQVQNILPPLLVCEPVLTECLFLLRHLPAARRAIFDLLHKGAIAIQFNVADNLTEIQTLLSRYEDRPMSLADACIVRMAELNSGCSVLTLDSDFIVYRKHSNQPIRTIYPG